MSNHLGFLNIWGWGRIPHFFFFSLSRGGQGQVTEGILGFWEDTQHRQILRFGSTKPQGFFFFSPWIIVVGSWFFWPLRVHSSERLSVYLTCITFENDPALVLSRAVSHLPGGSRWLERPGAGPLWGGILGCCGPSWRGTWMDPPSHGSRAPSLCSGA